ncbi:MAG: methyltransferase domain-containing protein [Hyphomonadaceae bacterium]|nr:methyltransferase domain-containing protein [Hyphomonadaceae bacterium]
MNLYLLDEKRDKNLVVTAKAVRSVRTVGRATWRGFDIAPSAEPQIRVKGASAYYPFRLRPETMGWCFSGLAGLGRRGRVQVSFVAPGTAEPLWTPVVMEVDADVATPVLLPWRLDAPTMQSQPLDLLIHVTPKGAGSVFLGVHKALDRSQVIALCKGRGVEIGPGANPQIKPAADVDVSYIEQMPPEEWRRLYDAKGKIGVDESLWDRYRVGDAHELPVDDESLDFIFTSHVFEHLANPLKHLELWGRKLRKGGRIVAIVPDLAGAKDYAADLSTLGELVGEYDAGIMEPGATHYARYAALRNIKDGGKDMLANRFSIHAHFYTHANMAQLLEEAVRRFGFSGYAIVHTDNHKDFYFSVVK